MFVKDVLILILNKMIMILLNHYFKSVFIKDVLINLILIKGLWFYSIIILTVGVHKRCFN